MHAAEANLGNRLARESELVPCPDCHWINSDLVWQARRRMFRRMPAYAILLLVMSGIAFFVVQTIAEENYPARSPRPTILAEEVAACFAIAAIALFPLRSFVRRRRVDPNRHFPLPPEIPPGTPPAIIVVDDTREERGRLGLADVQYAGPAKLDGWAVLHSDQLLFPKVCCLCLNETESTYRPSLKISKKSSLLPVPICDDCRRLFRGVWWMTAFLSIAGAIAIGALALLIRDLDDATRYATASIIAIFTAAIAIAVIPDRICRPYRFGYIDRQRGVMKFASKNEEYTQRMIEQAHQIDAALAAQAIAGRS